jgi:hypothetical protein
MKTTTDGPKLSRYLTAGSPQQCFLPSCHKAFEQSCVRGEDGHFYCSHACSEIGGKLDLSRVEELRAAPPSPQPLPTPKQKLSGRG